MSWESALSKETTSPSPSPSPSNRTLTSTCIHPPTSPDSHSHLNQSLLLHSTPFSTRSSPSEHSQLLSHSSSNLFHPKRLPISSFSGSLDNKDRDMSSSRFPLPVSIRLSGNRVFPFFVPKRFSLTGVTFSPHSPNEYKMMTYEKRMQIAQRKMGVHKLAETIWPQVPTERWDQLTQERSRQLIEQFGDDRTPSDWKVKQFYLYTLESKCPWKYEEVTTNRRLEVEKWIDEIFTELRIEADANKYGKLLCSKNELTLRLARKNGNQLPSSEEVEMIWADRHRILNIEWQYDD